MSGIYLHIPFCKQACHYCNFHFSTSLRHRGPMLEAIKKELLMRKDYLEGQKIKTVYFGGGTPSLLTAAEILDIWKLIEQHYDLDKEMEVTLEANPDDLSLERLQAYKLYSPINRLSIGIQSFHEGDLQYMNRAHSGVEAKDCLGQALATGFSNISIDFIYGTPTMSDDQWRYNLRTAFAYGIPHISCYALTVEPKTALQHMIVKGKTTEVSEEQTARQFEILLAEMKAQGYEQYEISNFCRPPHYAQHNSSYWRGAHYLGVGPSAHSFNGHSRQWNIANNAKYIKALEEEQLAFEIEELSVQDQYNEYLLTALRTKWGVDLEHISKHWGKEAEAAFQEKTANYMQDGYIKKVHERLILTDEGKLLADHIISDLFWL
jgi:oxygen-independent coproporphyrinogen-3 oxidase